MQYHHDVLAWTAISTGTFAANDLVGFDGAKVVADDAPVMGVAKHPCTVIGDPAGLTLIGIARVKASGAITAGSRVVSAAAGGVKTAATPVNDFATALTSAADGEFVDILIR